jgi:hypothetical protein
MQSLGDFFSDDLKSQLATDNFKIGAVLKYGVDFTNPPKSKRLIIVGFDNESVSFVVAVINSEINSNLFQTEALRNLHLPLVPKGGTDYINHPSFVDCSQIFEQSIETVKTLMVSTPSIHIGNLSEKDIANVLTTIKGAKTISIKKKKRYGLM